MNIRYQKVSFNETRRDQENVFHLKGALSRERQTPSQKPTMKEAAVPLRQVFR